MRSVGLGLVMAAWCAAPAWAQGLDSALGHREQPLGPDTRRYDQQHLALDLRLDLAAGTVTGTATHTLQVIADGTTELRFHCQDTVVDLVELADGTACPHRLDADLLRVTLPTPAAKGTALTLRIAYTATPTRGLYFKRPSDHHPSVPLQVWSQGEGQDNRHWIPCYDLPDDRLTTEIRVRVPLGLTVISNGAPVAAPVDNADGTSTHHWKLAQRHVSYLISLIVGTFDSAHDDWEGIALDYHVAPGQGPSIAHVFGRSPKMMAFFSEYTGRKHPWPRYAQTCVWDFLYGGMENTGATTLNLRAVHGPEASPDYSADGLIAHEMAHMWFGDLITCRTFEHIWLNEGFATYFTDLWFEHHAGHDEFRVRRHRYQQGYMKDQDLEQLADLPAAGRDIPRELGGGKAYSRGSLVLEQLRHELGADTFREAIRRWVATTADVSATTEQLRAACEAVAGRDLWWFFDQWVYGAGFPHLVVRAEWEPDSKTLVWRVRQVQPQRGAVGLFRFPVVVQAVAGDVAAERRVELHRAFSEWRQPLPRRPDRVRFNRGGWLAARVDIELPADWWVATLQRDDDVTARIDAVAALGVDHLAALQTAATGDAHWAVREDACARLAALAGEHDRRADVRPTLLAAADDADSRVRTAACEALGRLGPDAGTTAKLLAILKGDSKDFPRGAACGALGAIGGAGAVEGLRAALQVESYREEVRTQAVKALVRQAPDLALEWVRPFTAYAWGKGGQHALRHAAIDAVVELAATAPATVELCAALCDDPYHRMRSWAIGHLQTLGVNSPVVQTALKRVADTDPVGGNRAAATKALAALEHGSPGASDGGR